MKVLKFGGTSVGSVGRMQGVAQLLNKNEQQILVISAMSGTTNLLEIITKLLYDNKSGLAEEQINRLEEKYLTIADELLSTANHRAKGKQLVKERFQYLIEITKKEFTIHQEREVMAQGELLSTVLLYTYLSERNYDVVLLSALDFMRLDKDDEPDEYYIYENLSRKIKEHPHKRIFITQGYICRDYTGKVSNLKRGGSDYSASLIGAAIGVDIIQIWTDIDGIHNNDPRYVSDTYSIKEMSFDEAAELAYFGAKILHPTSILPAKKANIPVCLKNTMAPSADGTLITAKSNDVAIKAVAAKDGLTAIKIKSSRMLMSYGFLRQIFEVFEKYKTPIDMITTSEIAVSVTIDDDSYLDEIRSELKKIALVEIDKNQTIICIVGNLIANNKGLAGKIFTGIQGVPVRMISYGGSNHNISLLVNTIDKNKALNALNQHLF